MEDHPLTTYYIVDRPRAPPEYRYVCCTVEVESAALLYKAYELSFCANENDAHQFNSRGGAEAIAFLVGGEVKEIDT